MKKIIFIILAFHLIILQFSVTAQPLGDDCGMTIYSPPSSNSVTDGEHKPVRSDKSNGIIVPEPNQQLFPVLIVCVQFKNESYDHPTWDWHPGQPPDYINDLITIQKVSTGNWWDRYNGKLVSDWWQEVSCGKMHVLGEAYPITLDYTWEDYVKMHPINITDRQRTINEHIWQKVTSQPNFNWQFYDQWKKENGLWVWGNGDGYIDMIYKVHRTNPSYYVGALKFWVLPHYEGYGYLSMQDSYTYSIPNTNLKINYSFGVLGSGLTLQGHDNTHLCMNKSPMIDLMSHEHGHFLLGSASHIKHAKMNAGTSRDFFFSPWERIKFNYISSEELTYEEDNHTYYLNDFSGRDNTNPIILQLPIRENSNGLKEYYLIVNRRKESQFDIFMMGDTARRNAFRNINPEYGKGVYIYHIPRDMEYSNSNKIDLECADGLFYWTVGTSQYPDWSVTDLFPYFYPETPDRDYNDCVDLSNPSLDHVDGITSFYNTVNLFSLGKKHTCVDLGLPCNEATDKYHTNNREVWTSWPQLGDRWDAWNLGYNEVFSPYSSPSTRNWDHDQTGIFIWYKNLVNGTAYIDIYRTGFGGYNEEIQILEITPPSRPMGIKKTHVLDLDPNLTGIYRPKITWNHNMEPDMVRDNGKKKYIVYRALSDNMWTLPGPYYVRAVLEIDASSPAEYIDYQIIDENSTLNSQEGYEPYPLRYRVVAVDKFDDSSVPSDFADAKGLKPEGSSIDPGNGDNIVKKEGLPTEYNLTQNYPNPFNPVTKINYAIPKQGLVTLKVYDILGREVRTLVNEVKAPGNYAVEFNGNDLSSGVYFYRIQSNEFTDIKRMILIK